MQIDKQKVRDFTIRTFERGNEKGKVYIFMNHPDVLLTSPVFSKDTPQSLKNDPKIKGCFKKSTISLALMALHRRAKVTSVIQRNQEYIKRHPTRMKVLSRFYRQNQKSRV